MEGAAPEAPFWSAGDSMNTQSSPSFQGPLVSISPLSPDPVESLKNWSTRPGVGAMRPMLNVGLFMLSSARENAFM